MAQRRLLVIVPCLNEEESLPGLLDQLEVVRAAMESALAIDVLVVDDGSSDNTFAIASQRSHVRVAQLCFNLGIGAAVQTGLRVAARENYDWAMQVDGDGQHPPSEIGKLLQASEEGTPDLVIGSRFMTKAGFQSTRLRRVGIAWLALLLRVAAGIKITDPTSGFRLFGRRAIELFSAVYPVDFPEPESLAIARAARLAVVEVSIVAQPRQGGASSIFGFQAAYYMVKVSLALLLTIGRHANLATNRRNTKQR